MAFAKLYGNDENQVLVKLGAADDGPEIQFYFQPPGLGVCMLAIGFPASAEGWEAAETAFASTTEDRARRVVAQQMVEHADLLAITVPT
jgi:hypothetical protein